MQMGICSTLLNNNKPSEKRDENNDEMTIEENNQQQIINTQDNSTNDIQPQEDNPQNLQSNTQQQNNQQQNYYQQDIQQKIQKNIKVTEENGKKLENEDVEKGEKEEKGENDLKKEKGEIGKKEEKKHEEKENNKEKENEGKKEEEKEEENFIIQKDFDYSLLDKLLEKADKNKKNIILLTTGSYNPIHRMHLEILNIAANFILSLNKYNVLCGFISPSADCYVKHKKPPLISFDLRCKLVKTAIDEYDLENNKNEHLKIFLHTWEGSHDYFIDFPYVIEEIQNRLLEKNITLIYVCGLDLFINCRYYFSQNVIAVDRKPYKNKYKDIPGKFIYIIKDEKTEPYSSTFIRDCFVKKDYQSIEKVTFPKVAKMIIEFYKDNFK